MSRVLILEDDPVARLIWETVFLTLEPNAIIESYSGIDAVLADVGSVDQLEIYYDMMVIDIFLVGDETGMELVASMSPQGRQRVIVSSSISSLDFEKLCKIHGFQVRFVQKPIRAAEVILAVQKISEVANARLTLLPSEVPMDNRIEVPRKVKNAKSERPVIFVTGCSSGIGAHLAKLLVDNPHYNVVLTARQSSFERLTDRYVTNERLLLLPLDMTNMEQIKRVVAEVLHQWGRIDILVNNAGVCYRSVMEQMDVQSELNQMTTNYLGPMSLIRYVIPVMRESGRGKIINVSSVSGILGMPTMGSYSASKFAIEGATEALWYELRPFGINVTLVRPGFINSDGFTHVKISKKAELAEQLRGPYSDFYHFMKPFIARLMRFSRSTSQSVAEEILLVIQTQNPPLCVNATLDAKMLVVLKKLLPFQMFTVINNIFFRSFSHWGSSSKAKQERVNILSRLQMKYFNHLLIWLFVFVCR